MKRRNRLSQGIPCLTYKRSAWTQEHYVRNKWSNGKWFHLIGIGVWYSIQNIPESGVNPSDGHLIGPVLLDERYFDPLYLPNWLRNGRPFPFNLLTYCFHSVDSAHDCTSYLHCWFLCFLDWFEGLVIPVLERWTSSSRIVRFHSESSTACRRPLFA